MSDHQKFVESLAKEIAFDLLADESVAVIDRGAMVERVSQTTIHKDDWELFITTALDCIAAFRAAYERARSNATTWNRIHAVKWVRDFPFVKYDIKKTLVVVRRMEGIDLQRESLRRYAQAWAAMGAIKEISRRIAKQTLTMKNDQYYDILDRLDSLMESVQSELKTIAKPIYDRLGNDDDAMNGIHNALEPYIDFQVEHTTWDRLVASVVLLPVSLQAEVNNLLTPESPNLDKIIDTILGEG